jgi:rod shape-determining protein MreD
MYFTHNYNLTNSIVLSFASFILFMVNYLALNISAYYLLFPNVILVIIYFDSLNQFRIISPYFLLITGLLIDCRENNIIGISPLIFLLLQQMVIRYKRFFYKKPFIAIWLGFCLFLIAACTMQLVIYQYLIKNNIDAKNLFLNSFFTFFSYPLLYIMINKYYLFIHSKTSNV